MASYLYPFKFANKDIHKPCDTFQAPYLYSMTWEILFLLQRTLCLPLFIILQAKNWQV